MSPLQDDPLIIQYFHDIEGSKGLSSEVEIELAERIKRGDEEALQQLVEANLLFVVSVAKRYLHRGLSLPELISAGNIGLVIAAKRFDGKKGFKFISYAMWWIRQSVSFTLAEHSRLIHLPSNQVEQLSHVSKITKKLEHELGRPPTSEEVAQEAEMESEDVDTLLFLQQHPLSLDAPFNEESENCLADTIPDDPALASDEMTNIRDLKEAIKRALHNLTEIEAQVLCMYYGIERDEPMTLEMIGMHFVRTQERIRQIKEKALKKLRYSSKSKVLREYY